MSYLAELNKHEYDSRICFRDEGHKYWIDNSDIDIISATTFIHTFFGHFNSNEMINNIIKSNKYKDPTYKYYKMSAKDIKKLWDDNRDSASNLGTELHKDIENFYNRIEVQNDSVEFKYFKNFIKDFPELEGYRTEWFIFSDILRITGSIDITFINKDGTLSLGDWKRSKKIEFDSEYNKTALFPINHIPDCNYYKYSLQLNLYKFILERFYNKVVKDMFLIVIHPENKNENYIKIEINNLQKEIEMMIDSRKKDLLKKGYSSEKLDKVKISHSIEDVDIISEDGDTKPKSFLKRPSKVSDEDTKPKSFLKKPVNIEENKKIIVVKDQHEKSFLRGKSTDEDITPTKMIKIEDITYLNLSKTQKHAYDLISKGRSVFLTGKAGGGKSAIINLFFKQFNKVKNIGITSTTGTSAILIGGYTVHSYLGIGLGTADAEILYMNIKNRTYMLKRWLELNTLIIDEISMLSPGLFDKLEQLARIIRKNDLPFGGIQLILTGDFLQLPCVNSSKFCFESKTWNDCIDDTIYLKEIYRQSDPVFQECLSEVRLGELSQQTIDILRGRENAILKNDLGILPTKIYALNKDVDKENEKELNKMFTLNNDLEFFEYDMTFTLLRKSIKNPEEKAQKGCLAPSKLELCVGAQVMLLYNMDLDAKLANGSRGVIIKFIDDLPIVRFLNGEERTIDYHKWVLQENGIDIMELVQIPLKIAYAISIHKCQGFTVDYAEIDMEGIFEDGMAYVALSRVSSLSGLSIKNYRTGSIFANQKAVEFYKNLE